MHVPIGGKVDDLPEAEVRDHEVDVLQDAEIRDEHDDGNSVEIVFARIHLSCPAFY